MQGNADLEDLAQPAAASSAPAPVGKRQRGSEDGGAAAGPGGKKAKPAGGADAAGKAADKAGKAAADPLKVPRGSAPSSDSDESDDEGEHKLRCGTRGLARRPRRATSLPDRRARGCRRLPYFIQTCLTSNVAHALRRPIAAAGYRAEKGLGAVDLEQAAVAATAAPRAPKPLQVPTTRS
jgi:hypothetical protein